MAQNKTHSEEVNRIDAHGVKHVMTFEVIPTLTYEGHHAYAVHVNDTYMKHVLYTGAQARECSWSFNGHYARSPVKAVRSYVEAMLKAVV